MTFHTPQAEFFDSLEKLKRASEVCQEADRITRLKLGRAQHRLDDIQAHLIGVTKGKMPAKEVIEFILKEYFPKP